MAPQQRPRYREAACSRWPHHSLATIWCGPRRHAATRRRTQRRPSPPAGTTPWETEFLRALSFVAAKGRPRARVAASAPSAASLASRIFFLSILRPRAAAWRARAPRYWCLARQDSTGAARGFHRRGCTPIHFRLSGHTGDRPNTCLH